MKRRFEKLLSDLKNEFLKHFYEHALYTTVNSLPDMLWFKRLDGIHTMVNDKFCEVLHKDKADIEGKDHFDIWDVPRPKEGDAAFACAESEEIAINTGRTYICDEPVKTRDGMKQLTTYKTPVYDMLGNVFGTVGIGHDVTNFSNLGIELSILVENIPFPMIIFTSNWEVVRMNSSFTELADLTGGDTGDFKYKKWKDDNLIPVHKQISDSELHFTMQEIKIICDNEMRSYIVREQEIRDFFDNVSGYFCIMQDITYQRAYERSILQAANTDTLTGMYNRRFFYNHLNENSHKPMTLFYMDLDKFKEVNDSYGHAKGDEVLIKTASIITSMFPDAVSARLGGDEFALVIDGIASKSDIESKKSELERKIKTTFSSDGLGVTMSIGIATHNGEALNVDEFMHMGDARMYEIKKQHHSR